MGVERGSHYSTLAKAAFIQDVDPSTALAFYQALAATGDCRAQVMLAWMNLKGIGTPVNEARAYYWGRLAARDDYVRSKGPDRFAAAHRPVPYFEDRAHAYLSGLAGPRWAGFDHSVHQCKGLLVDARGTVGALLSSSPPFAEEVHDALLQWRKGDSPPSSFGKYDGTRFGSQSVGPSTSSRSKTASSTKTSPAAKPRWKPVAGKFLPPASQAGSLEALYEELTKSVYVIVAARTPDDLDNRSDLAQGSAVAIDTKRLLTNCHIIDGRPVARLVVRDGLVPLVLTSSRIESDTCVLEAKADQLVPIARVRAFDTLRIGEAVLAIGSPSGFTNSLTTGIVSQVRKMNGRRLIQTNASISGGSSGGGLFDSSGNLIGITTFKIKGAEGLNFAIAVDEYLR